MAEEGLVDIKFRLPDGSDIGPFRFSPASTVQMLKERIITDWPEGNPTVPTLPDEIKLISFGEILENNKTVGQCISPIVKLADTITVMHVVLQTAVSAIQSMLLQHKEWLKGIEKKTLERWDQHKENILELQRKRAASGSSTSHVSHDENTASGSSTSQMHHALSKLLERIKTFEENQERILEERILELRILELMEIWMDGLTHLESEEGKKSGEREYTCRSNCRRLSLTGIRIDYRYLENVSPIYGSLVNPFLI